MGAVQDDSRILLDLFSFSKYRLFEWIADISLRMMFDLTPGSNLCFARGQQKKVGGGKAVSALDVPLALVCP